MSESEFKKVLLKKEIIVMLLISIAIITGIATCNPGPKLSDHDAFCEFYKAVIAETGKMDEIYRPFGNAAGKQRWMEAAVVAKRIKEPINNAWYQFSLIKVPDLKNKHAQKDLENAKDDLESCYNHKTKIIEVYLGLIKGSSGSMDAGADILHRGERVQTLLVSGILSLHMAREKLGIKIEDIK